MPVRALPLWMALLLLPGAALVVGQDDAADIRQIVERTKLGVLRDKAFEARYSEILAAGDKAIGPIRDKLLGENDESLRIAAAMLLARIAEKSSSPGLEKLLQRCWNDSSVGVNYWGLHGMLKLKTLSSSRAESLVIESLGLKRPYPIRLLGCDASRERKVRKAVPWLVAIIVKRASQYAAAKKDIFVEEVQVRPEGGFGDEGEAPEVKRQPIVLGKTRPNVVQTAGTALERHPAVAEVRCAGIALESLVAVKFGFAGSSPWELSSSLVRAKEWFEANKAKYPGGPQAEDKEKAGPAPPGAAKAGARTGRTTAPRR